MKAIWGTHYDLTNDKNYQRPSCPACGFAIFGIDGYCSSCDDWYELDEEMVKWITERSETKTEVETCIFCTRKMLHALYRRNPITMKWQQARGHCEGCGVKYIV